MRCRLHPCEIGRSGVCASCLRERLEALVAERKRHRSSTSSSSTSSPDRHSSSTNVTTAYCREFPSPFTRSMGDRDNHFLSTPHLNPKEKKKSSNKIVHSQDPNHTSDHDCVSGKESRRFSIFSALFRRKEKPRDEGHAGHARLPHSSRWFSSFLPVRHKNSRLFPAVAAGTSFRPSDRGMSPADDDDDDWADGGYFSDTVGIRRTPESAMKTPAKTTTTTIPTARRCTVQHNPSGFAFCLSPLMRPSPTRCCPEQLCRDRSLLPGETRVSRSGKHHYGDPTSFHNRSGKLVGFGKFPQLSV